MSPFNLWINLTDNVMVTMLGESGMFDLNQ